MYSSKHIMSIGLLVRITNWRAKRSLTGDWLETFVFPCVAVSIYALYVHVSESIRKILWPCKKMVMLQHYNSPRINRIYQMAIMNRKWLYIRRPKKGNWIHM